MARWFLAAAFLLLSASRGQSAEAVVSSNAAPAAPVSNEKSAPARNPPSGLNEVPTSLPPSNETLKKFQAQLDFARDLRRQKSTEQASHSLASLLESEAPAEVKRQALFEMAQVAQDEGKFIRAQQIFGQYLHLYSDDISVPEVLLRQGLIYRQMGVTSLALSKFYAVMSSALKLKLDNMDYYKKLVLQSQIEIADTYYQEGKFEDAADFFDRLLKSGNPDLNQNQTLFKMVRSLSYSTNHVETVARAENYLALYTNTDEIPEVRFFLASALEKLGRSNDSLKQVMLLLQTAEANSRKNPEAWSYWQQRAGNEIANQLYKEGDYFSALQIYLNLAQLDKSPGWQLPVWYQTALIYEQLQQWQKATDMYVKIMGRRQELTEAIGTPSLTSLLEMAKWRKDYIDWMQKAKVTQQSFVLNKSTNGPATSRQ